MLSRRGFLNGTVGAGIALAAPGVQRTHAQTSPPARKRMIVDAQVHPWKANTPDWPWLPVDAEITPRDRSPASSREMRLMPPLTLNAPTTASPTTLQVTLNGATSRFDISAVQSISFNGLGGNDSASIYGNQYFDSADLSPGGSAQRATAAGRARDLLAGATGWQPLPA